MMSTSDDPFATRTRLVVEHPKGGYRYIATQIVSPPPMVSWSNMHTRGLNETGLCYTWSYVTPADEPTDATAVGVPYYQWGNLCPLAGSADRRGALAPRAIPARVSRELPVRRRLRGDLLGRSRNTIAASHRTDARRQLLAAPTTGRRENRSRMNRSLAPRCTGSTGCNIYSQGASERIDRKS